MKVRFFLLLGLMGMVLVCCGQKPMAISQLGSKTVKCTWAANEESDLAGYKLFVWDVVEVNIPVDSSGSEWDYFEVGHLDRVNVQAREFDAEATEAVVSQLSEGSTYWFALSAFDAAENYSMATGLEYLVRDLPPQPPRWVGIALGMIVVVLLFLFLLPVKDRS